MWANTKKGKLSYAEIIFCLVTLARSSVIRDKKQNEYHSGKRKSALSSFQVTILSSHFQTPASPLRQRWPLWEAEKVHRCVCERWEKASSPRGRVEFHSLDAVHVVTHSPWKTLRCTFLYVSPKSLSVCLPPRWKGCTDRQNHKTTLSHKNY